MQRRSFLALPLLGLAAATAIAATPSDKPQTGLPVETLTIISHDGVHHLFHVQVATTAAEQVTGLMFRKHLPADGGMLFVWDHPQESRMWMHDTLIPLDMVFINADGTIRAITENAVPYSEATIDSHGPVLATLELPGGTTARLHIRVGDRVVQKIFGTS